MDEATALQVTEDDCVGCRETADYLRRMLAAAPRRGPRGKAGELSSAVCDLCERTVSLDQAGAQRALAKVEGRQRSATARLRRDAVVRALEHLARWAPDLELRAAEPVKVRNANVGGGAKSSARDRSAALDAGSDADAIRHAFDVHDRLVRIEARGRAEAWTARKAWEGQLAAVAGGWMPRPGGPEDHARRRTLAEKVRVMRAHERVFGDELPGAADTLDATTRLARLLDVAWLCALVLVHHDALYAIGPCPVPPTARAAAVLEFMRGRKLRKGETWAMVLGHAFADAKTREKWEPEAPGKMASEHERKVHAEQLEHGLEQRKRHGQQLLDLAVEAWFANG